MMLRLQPFALVLVYLGLVPALFAQQVDKGIEVYGTAEMIVPPNELYFHVGIGEYVKNSKKVGIEELEKQLEKAVIDAGIPRENLSLEQVFSYNVIPSSVGKSTEFLSGKQYSIKLSNAYPINTLIDKLDPLAVRQIFTGKVTHTKLAEYQKEVRQRAVRAAQEKASYMLQAIGYTPGRLMYMAEVDQGNHYPITMNANLAERIFPESQSSSPVEMQQIKIVCQVKAVFEIK